MSTPTTAAGHERCGAATRAGGACGLPAGHGTDHVGIGKCKRHGGSTPNHRKAAKKQQAVAAVATYGLAREIDPHEALLEELHRTAGHVAWLQQVVSDLEQNDLTHLIVTGGGDDDRKLEVIDERPNVYLDLYQRERKHFTDVAKTCIAVGIEERRVRVAEQTGAVLAQVIRGVLSDLGVADRPEVPDVVRRHLTLVSSAA